MFSYTPAILAIAGVYIIITVIMKFKIKSKKFKNKFIYGDFSEDKKSTTLVVFLSGFSGGIGSPLLKNASDFFLKKGFSVIEFNFCNGYNDKHRRVDAIKTEDMSLSVYVAEFKNIVDSFGKEYSRIVFVGHSFGAVVSILFLSKHRKYIKNTELVLWDPSLLPWKKEWMEMDFVFDVEKKLYFGKNEKEVINMLFYRECTSIKNTTKTLQLLNEKVCIIAAEKGACKDAKRYFSKIHQKKSSVFSVINGAGHLFVGKRIQKELFDKTIGFLKAE